jgi:hypothetical protein
MDERFTYLLVLATPAVCAFWFLYAIVITEIANWSTCHRPRNNKPTASAELPRKKPRAATTRAFDYPELFCEDTLQRIRELEKRIAACDQEIKSLRSR